MENATSPEAGTAGTDTSFDKGVDDTASLLSEPDEDLQNEEQAHAKQGSGPDDASDAVDDQVDAEEGDGPDEIAAGGRFVSRDAKVRLDDGTVISVGDLARNNLYQRDYTRKTEELKAERETLKASVPSPTRSLRPSRPSGTFCFRLRSACCHSRLTRPCFSPIQSATCRPSPNTKRRSANSTRFSISSRRRKTA